MANFTALKILLVITAALSMAACAPSNQERQGRASTSAGTNGVATASSSPCGSAAGVVGRVYDGASANAAAPTSAGGTFEARVKGLISANYNPQYIGTIEGINGPSATCVTIEGNFKFDSAGALLADQTTVQMQVYDSKMNELDATGKPAGAFPIAFAKAVSGSLRSDQSFDVTFTDSFGSVTVSGKIQQNQINGQIQYANAKNISGGAPAAGYLGAFSINTSSLIK